jgi:hypothetical protein
MADKLVVSGARGASVTEIARRTGNFGVAPTDGDYVALEKIATALLEENPGFQSTIPGPADNTYTTLAAFKASDTARKVASLVDVPGIGSARFSWVAADFSGVPTRLLDYEFVKANAFALTAGAWVRYRDVIDLADFGVRAGTTQDYGPQIAAALAVASSRDIYNYGPGAIQCGQRRLRCPAGAIRTSQTMAFTGNIHIYSDGGPFGTIFHYTGNGRPFYVNSVDPSFPNGPQNVQFFSTDGICWVAPAATQRCTIGNSSQPFIRFRDGYLSDMPLADYMLHFTDSCYFAELDNFILQKGQRGCLVDEYCDLFTAKGRASYSQFEQEAFNLRCPTFLFENIDFELGNTKNLPAGQGGAFIVIDQTTTVGGALRAGVIRGVRFGPETAGTTSGLSTTTFTCGTQGRSRRRRSRPG